MPVVPDAASCELSPDCLCEILSPSTASFDRVRTLAVCAGAEVVRAEPFEAIELELSAPLGETAPPT